MSDLGMVIVGAGEAGARAAVELRSEGWSGTITLIGERGCSVTVIEVASRILMRGVPKDIADIVEARHRTAGVVFKIGIGLERIESSKEKHKIPLADGSIISCDAIIIGIGAIPETSLAAEYGLEIENGIRVDEMLRTSDPHIFAAGDCCSFPHLLYGSKRIRLEAWRNAQDQGSLVASNMLGGRTLHNRPLDVV